MKVFVTPVAAWEVPTVKMLKIHNITGAPNLNQSVLAIECPNASLIIVLEKAICASTVNIDGRRIDNPQSPCITTCIGLAVVKCWISGEAGNCSDIERLWSNWIWVIIRSFCLNVA